MSSWKESEEAEAAFEAWRRQKSNRRWRPWPVTEEGKEELRRLFHEYALKTRDQVGSRGDPVTELDGKDG